MVSAPLSLLDLFSGIGGFSLGLERSGGFKTAAFCEIDPFCRRVLTKHWPDVPQYDDIRTLTAERLRADGISVDAICGGFPCQDVSIAGNRRGLEGERSGLWFECWRLLCQLRPEFAILENTPGLLSLGMETVLGDLASVGYDVVWHCIPASCVGASHDRDRTWLVAHAGSQRRTVGSNDNGEHAGEVLQNIDRLLALSLYGHREQQPDADPIVGFGARIPDGRAERTAFIEAALRRKDDGLPGELDAVAALGNAVVPQIPELIGRAIIAEMSSRVAA